MKGLVVDVLKAEGDLVQVGEPIAILSAMKMETIISSTCTGRISKLLVRIGDALDSGDLVAIILK
jgi:pyruvate carboxylase